MRTTYEASALDAHLEHNFLTCHFREDSSFINSIAQVWMWTLHFNLAVKNNTSSESDLAI
jgi:hypothetical protein